MPDPGGEHEGDDRAEQHGEPGGDAEDREQHEQEHDRDQGDEAGEAQIADGIDGLGEHVSPFCARVSGVDFLARSAIGMGRQPARTWLRGRNTASGSAEQRFRTAAERDGASLAGGP